MVTTLSECISFDHSSCFLPFLFTQALCSYTSIPDELPPYRRIRATSPVHSHSHQMPLFCFPFVVPVTRKIHVGTLVLVGNVKDCVC